MSATVACPVTLVQSEPVRPRATYVVASTPRTGSSLLCAVLSATGMAGRPGEFLGPSSKSARAQLSAAMAANTTPNGVFGIKLHWHQFAYAVRNLRRGTRQPQLTAGQLINRNLRRPCWFHLYRRDTAAQALSYFRAIHSGVWSVPPGGEVGRAPQNPDLRQVAWLEDLLIEHERRWRGFFDRNRIRPLEIAYEELDEHYPSIVESLLSVLGVEDPTGAIDGPRPLQRQADAWSEHWLGMFKMQRGNFPPQEPETRWANIDILVPRPTTKLTRDSGRTSADVTSSATSLRYSCVVDIHPRFEYESLIWVLTLLHLARRPASEIVVHAIDGVRDRHISRLRALGIEVVTVAPFDNRLPFANKLRQLTSPALDADVAVLCDCDLAFSSDPTMFLPRDAVGGKVVDTGTPLYNVWIDIADLAGLRSDTLELARSRQFLMWTYAKNINGGFLTVPRSHLPALADAWPRWLEWVLEHGRGSWPLGDRRVRFGRHFRWHAFQVSFGLAITELDLPVLSLPDELNFGTTSPQMDRGGPEPIVVHFHRWLTENGLLRRTGVDNIDRAIETVNALLTTEESEGLLAEARTRWATARRT